MKKNLLLSLMLISTLVNGQTVLFSENFETGNSTFTLNTTDVNSTSSGYNSWTVNNAYSGGSGSVTCLGFPFTFTIPNTPSQPAGITGNPNSYYLHTVSDAAIASGVSNCCFLAADGICNSAERYFAAMTNDISTSGYDTVTLSFWWICEGGNNSFGEVYYSLNSGSAWTKITNPISNYNNNGSWAQQNITLPSFANQTTLRFGFRFVNQVATAANDPGFGIDEIKVTGVQNVVLPVVNFTSNIQTFCEESCVQFTDLSTNNPASWQWYFPGALPNSSTQQNPLICYTQPGSYDVTLVACNSNGCDSLTIPGFIQVNPNPPAPVLTINGDTICATFNSNYTYQWYYNVSTLIPGATNYCYIAVFPGSYHVIVTDPTGCQNSSDTVVVTGINELSQLFNSFSLVGNPFQHSITVEINHFTNHVLNLEIINAEGKLVFNKMVVPNYPHIKLKTPDLSSGVYSVQLSDGKNKAIKKAVVY
ncbi:MAG: PKD domain-containing protein [Bacteroidia bacterium]|nr:PKD domain-containing protein [Bacteroidia bacterium]